jgi:hypothetical protein
VTGLPRDGPVFKTGLIDVADIEFHRPTLFIEHFELFVASGFVSGQNQWVDRAGISGV